MEMVQIDPSLDWRGRCLPCRCWCRCGHARETFIFPRTFSVLRDYTSKVSSKIRHNLKGLLRLAGAWAWYAGILVSPSTLWGDRWAVGSRKHNLWWPAPRRSIPSACTNILILIYALFLYKMSGCQLLIDVVLLPVEPDLGEHLLVLTPCSLWESGQIRYFTRCWQQWVPASPDPFSYLNDGVGWGRWISQASRGTQFNIYFIPGWPPN